MNKAKTVLFLYTEIAEYFLACARNLVKEGLEIHIVRFPINKEAPFHFPENNDLKLYNRSDYDYKQMESLADSINPDLIICSGWIDKDYLKICKKYFKKIPTVLTLDNHWKGNIKQKIATYLSPVFLLNRFSHCWVPGDKQQQYAIKLGFKKNKIEKGFYCADTDYFSNYYNKNIESKKKKFPKRFLYAGRYYEFKGLTDLWTAFVQLQEENPNEWELWCLGTGNLKPIQHPKIKHFGFIQPNEMDKFIAETGVFVLPSRFEPWAVVIHEFACSGFPIICSDAVGAAEKFVRNNENGFIFKHQDIHSIKNALKKISFLSEKELLEMGNKSHIISREITLDKWALTVQNFIK